MTRLDLTRQQILSHRRRVGALDQRLRPGRESVRKAAWAGLQDSMPRAALLSLHARVQNTQPTALEDTSVMQLWGPRYSVYVVPADDRAIFSLGRMPETGARRRLAEDLAARLATFLDGRELPIHAAARRYVRVYGPTTAESFVRWAGIDRRQGVATFQTLRKDLAAVRTPIGDAWILAEDEAAFRADAGPGAPARLLPSGDAYYLLQERDRELVVDEPERRASLWTSRVWPGAVLVDGDVVGTWRRSQHNLTIEAWRALSPAARAAVEAEAASLPLPGVEREIAVRWEG